MFNKNYLTINNAKKNNVYTFIPEFKNSGKAQSVGFTSGVIGYLSPNIINYDNIEYKITRFNQHFMQYDPEGCFIETEPELLNKQIRITDIVTNNSTIVKLNDSDLSNNLYFNLGITIENAGKTFYLSLEII